MALEPGHLGVAVVVGPARQRGLTRAQEAGFVAASSSRPSPRGGRGAALDLRLADIRRFGPGAGRSPAASGARRYGPFRPLCEPSSSPARSPRATRARCRGEP